MYRFNTGCLQLPDPPYFNVYCKKRRGRAKQGRCTITVLPPSQAANLQIQCAINTAMGVVLHRLQRGSIQMDYNVEFVEEIYQAVTPLDEYRINYVRKQIAIGFDNAPCHNQTDKWITERRDLTLLRLASYSLLWKVASVIYSRTSRIT